MSKNINRRQFLKLLATMTAAAGGALLAKLQDNKVIRTAAYPLEDDTTFLPMVISDKDTTTPKPPTGSRVVHVHNSNATNWNGSSTDYWNYINQDQVNSMVDEGLKQLTGKTSVYAAWESLIPNYTNGKRIAIKVNFNNCKYCDHMDEQIDAIIHPINAVIRGLKEIGIAENDICVFDSSRYMPDYFVDACQYNDILFVDVGCQSKEGFSMDESTSYIDFNVPTGVPLPPSNKVTDTLIKATYVINMPIMKAHGRSGVTLSFKNHFGSVKGPIDLHPYITSDNDYYDPNYSPLVDIYQNIHIRDKTVLIIGEGIFGNWLNNVSAPAPWKTFDNQYPKSMFFATDPVAIDSVMYDFLDAERSIPASTNDHLILASNKGLGVFERGDPWGSGYNKIDYIRINQ